MEYLALLSNCNFLPDQKSDLDLMTNGIRLKLPLLKLSTNSEDPGRLILVMELSMDPRLILKFTMHFVVNINAAPCNVISNFR